MLSLSFSRGFTNVALSLHQLQNSPNSCQTAQHARSCVWCFIELDSVKPVSQFAHALWLFQSWSCAVRKSRLSCLHGVWKFLVQQTTFYFQQFAETFNAFLIPYTYTSHFDTPNSQPTYKYERTTQITKSSGPDTCMLLNKTLQVFANEFAPIILNFHNSSMIHWLSEGIKETFSGACFISNESWRQLATIVPWIICFLKLLKPK